MAAVTPDGVRKENCQLTVSTEKPAAGFGDGSCRSRQSVAIQRLLWIGFIMARDSVDLASWRTMKALVPLRD